MGRVLATIVLPLLLPTALYLVWLRAVRWSRLTATASHPAGRAAGWAELPWLWLAGAGVALLAAVLLVVTVHFGVRQRGVYVAPRWQNGEIIPGHMAPIRSGPPPAAPRPGQ